MSEWRPPQKDDKYWMDGEGKFHHIPRMDWQYAEACIRKCHNEGWETPEALFTRWKERHKDNIKLFKEMSDD